MNPLVTLFALIIILVWLTVLSLYVMKNLQGFQRIIKGNDKTSLSEKLDNILDRLELDKAHIEEIKKGMEYLNTRMLSHIQKISLVRYNPFSDTGGEQSFIIALLDGNENGIVLSSLHTRGTTRWYAKNIREGKGEGFELSREEQEAIRKASKLKS